MNMDASRSSEVFVSMYQIKWHHMYEERILDHILFLTLKYCIQESCNYTFTIFDILFS